MADWLSGKLQYGFTCSGAAHQNKIVGILGERARTKGFNLRLQDSGRWVSAPTV
jgi:hypothetical protein